MLIQQSDIEALWQWSHEGDTTGRVRELHRQIVAELTDTILVLQTSLLIAEQKVEMYEEMRREELRKYEPTPKDTSS